METFSALLAICAGNSPVPGEFPTQRPVTRSFDVFFDLRLNKRLNKQWWGWWFETLSLPLWRHRNDYCDRVRTAHKRPSEAKNNDLDITPPDYITDFKVINPIETRLLTELMKRSDARSS